jgi:hypothetical protein
MARVVKCPKCGELGSLQPKKTKHGVYWRVGHYLGLKGKTRMVKWCYIGKELPETVKKQLVTQNKTLITQEFTQTTQKSDKPKIAFKSENIVSGGVRVWSKETGLGPVGVGLRGFKSRPPHHNPRFIAKPVNKQHVHI